jgi:UDP-N-acetylglucosamine 2-epimerase (non-hydrolysing)
VKLVGPHREAIVAAASGLLENQGVYAAMANKMNPYGDGKASERIVAKIRRMVA